MRFTLTRNVRRARGPRCTNRKGSSLGVIDASHVWLWASLSLGR